MRKNEDEDEIMVMYITKKLPLQIKKLKKNKIKTSQKPPYDVS